ncbi:head protein [Salmonella enterica]|nr:head protein [Salmonella enterica]
MIITPASISALNVAYNKHFQNGVKTADSSYKQIAMVVPSTAAANVYGWLGKFPQMKVWPKGASRQVQNMAAHAYTLPNIKYESTVGVDLESIEDDLVGAYGPIFEMQGQEAEQYPNRDIFSLLKDGHNSLCYDGQFFFDTDHPVYPKVDGTGTAEAVSNVFVGTGEAWYLMDTTKPVKPLIFQERVKPQIVNKTSAKDSDHVNETDELLYGIRARSAAGFGLWQLCVKSTKPLNAANFEEAWKTLRNMKGDGGDPLNVTPNLLVVPPNLEGAAQTVVGKETLANGESNTNYNKAKILDTAWLN